MRILLRKPVKPVVITERFGIEAMIRYSRRGGRSNVLEELVLAQDVQNGNGILSIEREMLKAGARFQVVHHPIDRFPAGETVRIGFKIAPVLFQWHLCTKRA